MEFCRKTIFLLIFLSFMSVGWGKMDKYEPYISPGIQIGLNTNKELFYGFQISIGVLHSPEGYIYSPSICFGFKKYNSSKLKEKYIDLQMMLLSDGRMVDGGLPIGFGIGINHFKGESSMRIKGYTWLFSCITIDYNIKRKLFNRSLIPVFPISEMM